MKLKIKPLVIPEDNPFQFDILNRRESAEILSKLISTLEEPSVIAIDSPWGHGKTTFVRMLRQHLANNGFQTIYFNAWENDFIDDALSTLIGEIESGLNELSVTGGKKSKAKRTVTKLKRIGSYLAKKSAPVAIRLLTAGIVNTEEIYEQALADISEKIAREQIDNYEKAKRNFHNFRDKLSDFVKTVRDNNKRPVVFFIDELDRCRPNFAIEILEKAKHLFSVSGFVFVIAIDKKQIGHSIRSVYGQGMDVDGYLRRFIDFDYNLPNPDNRAYANYLFNQYEFNEYFSRRRAKDNRWAAETLTEIFGDLSTIFNLSLRVQEQCFSLITIILRTIAYNAEIHAHLLIFLLLLKATNTELYRKYISNTITAEELIEYIKSLDGGKDFFNKHISAVLEAYIVTARNNGREIIEQANRYEEITKSQSGNDHMRRRAETIYEVIKDIRNGQHENIANRLSKKIDISDRFLEEPPNE